MSDARYLVAGHHEWNRKIFDQRIKGLPGEWLYIDDPQALTVGELESICPLKVFLLHWSWILPLEIVECWECVGFHMTDLPYGRGGSPLQNLLLRGHQDTVLTAFRLTDKVDAGPIYLKRPLSLAGTAEEIYVRASRLAADMIEEIVLTDVQPRAQEGEVVLFGRRTPQDSEIPRDLSGLLRLYDFIRMLDASGYPRAFCRSGAFRLEFSRAALYDDRLVADVLITEEPAEK